MNKIAVSAGHSANCPGAVGIIDEFTENCRVVTAVAKRLNARGVKAYSFIDRISRDQNTNLNTIVAWHNSLARDLDVSIHFNANAPTSKPVGTEVLYVTQAELAAELSAAIAGAGALIDRGEKYRDNLYFLNNTEMPAVLIEVCFVDSEADVALYQQHFDSVVDAIVSALGGQAAAPSPAPEVLVDLTGKVSSFGGPLDTGVAPDEGLAFIYEPDQQPELFLPEQPPGTTGLARRLNPAVSYVACRWDYDVTPREMLLEEMAWVGIPGSPRGVAAYPADWGPHVDTGRVADISPGLMERLGVVTDDVVRVIFPFPAAAATPPPLERPRSRVSVALRVPDGVDLRLTVNGEELILED